MKPSARTRFYLFWCVCIPVRFAIAGAALAVTVTPNRWVFLLVGTYTLVTALGFAWNAWLTVTGEKTLGGFGGKVWWSAWRIVHMLLWGVCATLCFLDCKGAGAILVVDACVGVLAGLTHFIRCSIQA